MTSRDNLQILIGGVEGDPNFRDNSGDGVIDIAIPAAQNNTAPNERIATIVTLPAGKTCNCKLLPPSPPLSAALLICTPQPPPIPYPLPDCTMQWVWAARRDDGYYIGCADIAITTDGLLPNYNALPSEVGNELPG